MYDEYFLEETASEKAVTSVDNHSIDNLFNNLTEDIANVNRFISEVTKQQKNNETEVKELSIERKKLENMKLEFSNKMKIQEEELKTKQKQSEQNLLAQYDKLKKSEEDFRESMSKNFAELELEKKSLDVEKEIFEQQKQQFESYKKLETARLKQLEISINLEKEQFEKYKDVSTKKIELENKNLEDKCLRFKEIMKQFDVNFKPIKELEEE